MLLRLSVVLALVVSSLSVFGSARAADITVLNDTFDSPNYSTSYFNGADSSSNPDDISFANYDATSISGGNPGAVGQLSHWHDVDRDEFGDPLNGDGFTYLQSYFIDQTASYTPSLEGVILSISISLDVRTSDPINTLFFDISDSNGGSVAGGGSGFLAITNDGEWNTYTLTGVTQSGASGRDFAGSEPLRFGFGFLSSADVFLGSEQFVFDVDNFVVTVTPVPEPSTLALAGVGLLACLTLIRQKRRR